MYRDPNRYLSIFGLLLLKRVRKNIIKNIIKGAGPSTEDILSSTAAHTLSSPTVTDGSEGPGIGSVPPPCQGNPGRLSRQLLHLDQSGILQPGQRFVLAASINVQFGKLGGGQRHRPALADARAAVDAERHHQGGAPFRQQADVTHKGPRSAD